MKSTIINLYKTRCEFLSGEYHEKKLWLVIIFNIEIGRYLRQKFYETSEQLMRQNKTKKLRTKMKARN